MEPILLAIGLLICALCIQAALLRQKKRREDHERYCMRFAAENAAVLIQKAKKKLGQPVPKP